MYDHAAAVIMFFLAFIVMAELVATDLAAAITARLARR